MVRVVLVPTGSLTGLYLSSLARLLKSKLRYREPLLSHRFVVLSSFVNYVNMPISCELELSSEERIFWVNLQGVSSLPSLHRLWIVGGISSGGHPPQPLGPDLIAPLTVTSGSTLSPSFLILIPMS